MSLWSRVFQERRAILLPLSVFLAANLAVLIAVILPMQRGVVNDEEQAKQSKTDLMIAKAQNDRVKEDRTSTDRAKVELEKFYKEILPRDGRAAVRLTHFWLRDLAERHRLKAQAGTWTPEVLRESLLTVHKGEVTLSGEYANILRFLYELEIAPQFIIVDKVELAQFSTTPGSLDLALTVKTYYVDPTAPRGPTQQGTAPPRAGTTSGEAGR